LPNIRYCMKLEQVTNGHQWWVEIKADLNQLSVTDIKNIGRLATEKILVVLRGQNLSPEKEVQICEAVGSVEVMPEEVFHRCPVGTNGVVVPQIQRVTGRKDADNRPMGLFGHNEDLDWHANRASHISGRKSLVWLYAIEGSKQSKTSWVNTWLAFSQMPERIKSDLRNMRGYLGFQPGKYTSMEGFKSHINDEPFALVKKNPFSGLEGLYFPFNQLFGIEGMSDSDFDAFVNTMREHILQDKYMYHHYWEDGDVVISEQWFSLHKRWSCDVSQRLLHRITLDYSP
jgi:alpha-ketoglutarate-dependent taurine dioxygenase